jgi:hypothetical protein
VDDAGDGGGEAVALERLIAAEHFVEDEADGEKIGASVVGLLQKDFRGHVGGSAAAGGHGLHALGGFVGIAAPGAAGDAEVENLHPVAGGEHDVLGLDVAVDDAFFVSGLQAFATLRGDGEKFFGGNGLREAMAQGLALDVLHHEPEFAGVLDHVVDRADVGVVEGGGALGFLEQAFAVGVGGVGVGSHALDGDKRFSVVSSAP